MKRLEKFPLCTNVPNKLILKVFNFLMLYLQAHKKWIRQKKQGKIFIVEYGTFIYMHTKKRLILFAFLVCIVRRKKILFYYIDILIFSSSLSFFLPHVKKRRKYRVLDYVIMHKFFFFFPFSLPPSKIQAPYTFSRAHILYKFWRKCIHRLFFRVLYTCTCRGFFLFFASVIL